MKRSQSMFLILSLITIGAAASAQSRQSHTAPSPDPYEESLVTVNFPGGTAADYAAAIKKAAGNVNIVTDAEVRDVPMPAVELTDASVNSALFVLHGRTIQKNDYIIQLDMDEGSSGQPGEQKIYNISAILKNMRRPDPAQVSRVWSVAGSLADGLKSADILTAVQSSLDLLGEAYKPAHVKFHEATGLIIARGSIEQMQSIDEVVNQLSSRRGKMPKEAEERIQVLDKAVRDCQTERESLQRKIDALEREMNDAKKR